MNKISINISISDGLSIKNQIVTIDLISSRDYCEYMFQKFHFRMLNREVQITINGYDISLNLNRIPFTGNKKADEQLLARFYLQREKSPYKYIAKTKRKCRNLIKLFTDFVTKDYYRSLLLILTD
jgi:hypothetical protein